MPPRRLSREEKKAATREALLKAGEKVIAQKGFSASLEDFASAAGLTKGAIYSNFRSRNEFLFELSSRVAPGIQLEPDRNAASFRDSILKLVDEEIKAIERDPKQVILATDFFVQALRTPSLRRRMRREFAQWSDQATAKFAEWADSYGARLPLDAAELRIAIDAVSAGLALYRIGYGPEVVPDHLFRFVYERLIAPD